MPRPRRIRRIFFQPNITRFVPRGITKPTYEEILTYDEVETIRLKDLENLEQSKAAKKMGISQPTFSRLLDSSRKKIANAIVNGQAIKIQGGNFKMVQPTEAGQGRGMGMGRGAGKGGGRGRMGGFAAGPGGDCVCPKCGEKMSHQVGVPCFQQKCPKCGSPMTRG